MAHLSDTFRLHVPATYGDDRPVPVALLWLIEHRLRADFAEVSRISCLVGRGCSVYEVVSPDREHVFAVARSIARLLLQPAAWVGLPNGRVAVLGVDLDFFFA